MGDDDDTVFVFEILLITIPTHSFEGVWEVGTQNIWNLKCLPFFLFFLFFFSFWREYAPSKRLDWLNLLPVLFHCRPIRFHRCLLTLMATVSQGCFLPFWNLKHLFIVSGFPHNLDPSQRHWLVAQFSDQQKTYWKSSWRSICKISDLWPHQCSCPAKLLSKVRQVKRCHNSTQL